MVKARQHLRWIIVLGFTVLFLVNVEIISAENWEVVSKLPTHREGFSTAVVNGKIYLIGGTLVENRRGPLGLSIVEVYDPKTNQWRRVADMPTPRTSAEAAVVNGIIYVLGGYNAVEKHVKHMKFLDIVEAYNPQNDTWTRKQDLSTPHIGFGVGSVDNKIYTVGGTTHPLDAKPGDPGRIDLVEVYDPGTDMWAKRAKMPTRRDGFGVAVVNNRIYAIGGRGWPQFGPGGPFLTTIEAYNPKLNRWQEQGDMPNLRTAFSTVSLGEVIYLIGGFVWQGRNLKYFATVDAYNPETEKWSDIPPMSTPLKPYGAAAVDGKIYVFGGVWREGIGKEWVYITTVEAFDTGLRAVSAVGKLSTRWGALKAEHGTQP